MKKYHVVVLWIKIIWLKNKISLKSPYNFRRKLIIDKIIKYFISIIYLLKFSHHLNVLEKVSGLHENLSWFCKKKKIMGKYEFSIFYQGF